jgi:hypothetical protein
MTATARARSALRTASSAVLSPLRSRFGRRLVNWTPEFMGFGNHLYLWEWAYTGRDAPVARRVLMTEKMRPWAALVPDFSRRFIVERDEVGFLDQRDFLWARPLEHSGDPRGYTEATRARFVQDCLVPSPLLPGVGTGQLAADDVLTLNVRRGDYYSNPHHRPLHAFDVEAYLREAVGRSVDADGPLARIHVVSDDVAWCRERLDFLPRHAPEVTYSQPTASPASNFLDVCSSRRLVITNSTFSIWAAGVSTVVFGDNAAQIWAPAFFMASYEPGRCYEYDQAWSFVDELPGGWQPDWVLAGRDGP